MGTLDDDPGIRPSCHVFVGSKAPWVEIGDQLPQFDTFPPEAFVRHDGSRLIRNASGGQIVEGQLMKVLLTQLRVRSEDAGENFRGVARLLKLSRIRLSPDDILLLPELIGGESERKHYERSTSELACSIGCHVVGGTNHHKRRGKIVNSGVFADRQGKIVAAYDKLHPYSIETRLGVAPGLSVGQFEILDCRVLVLVCADFWYSDVFVRQIHPRPDLILVPTFSISRRPSPHVARSLWRSMAIARAYEFSVYVGISDWAYPCEYHGLRSSSVAGLADPRPHNSNGFFAQVGDRSLVAYEIDLPRLRDLRQYRNEHRFLSDETLVGDALSPRQSLRAKRPRVN
jgi:predicted amidohydrolase